MNKSNYKIAEYSKNALTNALLKLMNTYDFKEITVTQIAQEAGLSRKTFYRLFTNKDEILNNFLEDTINIFFISLKDKKLHNYWDVVELYFNFWEERKSLIQLFLKNNLLFLLYDTSYKCSFEAFEIVRNKETASTFSDTLPYLLAYSIGGMHSLLIKWIEDDMSVPYEEIISTLKQGFQSNNI